MPAVKLFAKTPVDCRGIVTVISNAVGVTTIFIAAPGRASAKIGRSWTLTSCIVVVPSSSLMVISPAKPLAHELKATSGVASNVVVTNAAEHAALLVESVNVVGQPYR